MQLYSYSNFPSSFCDTSLVIYCDFIITLYVVPVIINYHHTITRLLCVIISVHSFIFNFD